MSARLLTSVKTVCPRRYSRLLSTRVLLWRSIARLVFLVTLYTLYNTLCFIHYCIIRSQYAVENYSMVSVLSDALCVIQYVVLYTLLYNVQCTLYNALSICPGPSLVYNVYCTLYIVNVHCPLYSVRTVHIEQCTMCYMQYLFLFLMTILLTQITAAQNEVALSYYKVRGLYFVAIILVRSIV